MTMEHVNRKLTRYMGRNWRDGTVDRLLLHVGLILDYDVGGVPGWFQNGCRMDLGMTEGDRDRFWGRRSCFAIPRATSTPRRERVQVCDMRNVCM
jgi:hypothetical protein